jgi:hypothetical protein
LQNVWPHGIVDGLYTSFKHIPQKNSSIICIF